MCVCVCVCVWMRMRGRKECSNEEVKCKSVFLSLIRGNSGMSKD